MENLERQAELVRKGAEVSTGASRDVHLPEGSVHADGQDLEILTVQRFV